MRAGGRGGACSCYHLFALWTFFWSGGFKHWTRSTCEMCKNSRLTDFKMKCIEQSCPARVTCKQLPLTNNVQLMKQLNNIPL